MAPPFFFRYSGLVIRPQLVRSFTHAALSPEPDLAVAALMIARVEYPKLDAGPYLDQLDAIGHEARSRVAEMRFVGNELNYEDPRNSFLNEVLDRRTGIPITLALLYIEIARRAGVQAEGVNFPGHFLVRCRARRGSPYEDLIIDAFHGGALLSRDLLRRQAAAHNDEEDLEDFESRLLPRATKPQILARMLLNLKRLYVHMHSFPQARDVTELLIAVDPSAINELRDRGLLAYHLKDFAAALRDLETYLRLAASSESTDEDHKDHAQIWEHVKTLRKRVASLN